MGVFNLYFNAYNVSPPNEGFIYVYSGEKLMGKVKTTALRMHDLGPKLYSFGVLSDVHVTNSAQVRQRFIDTIKFMTDEENTEFICIAGDLTSQGTAVQIDSYIQATIEAKIACTREAVIHDTTGNHDVEQGFADRDFLQPYANGREPYTTRELFYSFTHGNDLFIMFGMTGWPGKAYNTTGTLFSKDSLQWLYNTLEANRNKRCFIFEHCPYFTSTGGKISAGDGVVHGWPAPTGGYISTTNHIFVRLLNHYNNAIWIHGHTHQPFKYQELTSGIVLNRDQNFISLHTPALAGEREMSETGYVKDHGDKGYGTVVDVYEEALVIRGLDLVSKKFLPIALYYVESGAATIPPKSFTDPSGTITT